jgi:hypothetical protein
MENITTTLSNTFGLRPKKKKVSNKNRELYNSIVEDLQKRILEAKTPKKETILKLREELLGQEVSQQEQRKSQKKKLPPRKKQKILLRNLSKLEKAIKSESDTHEKIKKKVSEPRNIKLGRETQQRKLRRREANQQRRLLRRNPISTYDNTEVMPTIVQQEINQEQQTKPEKELSIKLQILSFYEQQIDYLKGICIIRPEKNTLPECMKDLCFLHKLFKIREQDLFEIHELDIFNQQKNELNKKNEWKLCQEDCKKLLKRIFQKETNSTPYMIRFIYNSIIYKQDTYELKFHFLGKNENLTGLWNHDQNFFKMRIYKKEKDKTSCEKYPRLIMAYGPSGSGKSFWGKQMIKYFYGCNMWGSKKPHIFLSIDGGLARDLSTTYKLVVQENNLSGTFFRNLISSGEIPDVFYKSIFPSSKIKKKLVNYLQNQTAKIGIYIPSTTSGIANWVNDDKWIGLYIYQHRTEEECIFRGIAWDNDHNFKCKGTVSSGKARELEEGKRFSANNYFISKQKGKANVRKSPFCRLFLHNSGRVENSLLFEEMVDQKHTFFDKIKQKLYSNKTDEFDDGSWISEQTYQEDILFLEQVQGFEIMNEQSKRTLTIAPKELKYPFLEKNYKQYIKFFNKNDFLFFDQREIIE